MSTTLIPKAILCNQAGCQARTHKTCKKSPIGRYTSKPVYTCRAHRGEPPINSNAAPSDPADSARVYCLSPECRKHVRKPAVGQIRLHCIKCGKACHKQPECSGMKTEELNHKIDNWTCYLCTANYDVDQHIDLDASTDETAKGMKTSSKSSLRILQWNADGLKSKSDELASRLKALDIDIAVVQESWLAKSDKTPVIQDYCAIREDRRANLKRGGLIFYIKQSLPFNVAGYITKKGQ